jgi:hypothetical protein
MLAKITSLFVVGGALVVSRAATADPVVTDGGEYGYGPEYNDLGYGWNEPRLPTGIGVGITLGGGVSGFVDQAMRNQFQNSVNGAWNARVSVGTHTPLGLDVQYTGTAGSMNSLNGANNATLIGTAVEGALRWNILPHFTWDPYVFGGAGWQNYSISGTTLGSFNGIRSGSNSVSFPLGVGMSFRDVSGWLVDLRGTFRFQPDNNLLFQPTTGSFANTWQWEASAALGYEF